MIYILFGSISEIVSGIGAVYQLLFIMYIWINLR
jgi:hypothetical protein